MLSIARSLASIVAALCIAGSAAAAEPEPSAGPDRVPDLPRKNYFYLLGGWFDPQENAQLNDPNGHYGFALGFGRSMRSQSRALIAIRLLYLS